MITEWTPLRWPAVWTDPALLRLVKGAAINYLIVDGGPALRAVRERAREAGLHVGEPGAPPAGIRVIKGEWPGVRMTRTGAVDETSAGPTGAPWVDSNGWKVRLEAARYPDSGFWVDAPPKPSMNLMSHFCLIAIADAAVYGARWIITLDDVLARGIAGGDPKALAVWKTVVAASGFFAGRRAWADYAPKAVAGIVSDFGGVNEYFSQELLNLMARAGQQYRILLKDRPVELAGLRAVVYADAEPPAPALREQVLRFVEAGGMLITVPAWGGEAGEAAHPRFTVRALGKGKVAASKEAPEDPYVFANDAAVLVSHRYDQVRIWNGGAVAAYCTQSPEAKRTLAQLVFYADRGPDWGSVRVAGRYRRAVMMTVDRPAPRQVEMVAETDAVEIHMPPVSQYVALELEP
jgi:hypothetical protein